MSGLVILGIGFIAAVLIKRASKQRTERERQGVLEDSNESDSNESDYISDNEGLSTKEPARPRTYKNCSHFPQHVVDRSSYPYNMYYPDKCPKCTEVTEKRKAKKEADKDALRKKAVLPPWDPKSPFYKPADYSHSGNAQAGPSSAAHPHATRSASQISPPRNPRQTSPSTQAGLPSHRNNPYGGAMPQADATATHTQAQSQAPQPNPNTPGRNARGRAAGRRDAVTSDRRRT